MVATCLAIGYFSGMFTREGITTWYPTLVKPAFNPPNWIFAPVWRFLYLLMGISAGLIWHEAESNKIEGKKALQLFAIQLSLNFLWSILFFYLKNPFLALIEILLMWLMIYETFLKFFKLNTIAGKLLLPYLFWVSFATVLNASIWWLNL